MTQNNTKTKEELFNEYLAWLDIWLVKQYVGVFDKLNPAMIKCPSDKRAALWLQADIEEIFAKCQNADKAKKFILDKINESEYAKKVLKVINIDKAHLGGTIRRDWSKALKDVKRGAQLSNLVSYALSDRDLANLAEIYLQGNKNMQEKIEDLLTDCNFHTVCSDFMEGYYGKYIERAKMI